MGPCLCSPISLTLNDTEKGAEATSLSLDERFSSPLSKLTDQSHFIIFVCLSAVIDPGIE